ncbi:MAG: bifunctional phosphoribosylaminoimidazolecarboxamide formyltransferase/IMP cyclohydrolase [SAR324 cluster bacterium]|nr:bifunctional phosphoribosylaminoimidazolecarboxamide formyltransferase/IMP cyclohydrolase [SAR324 cluster bacterium]
MKQAYKIKRALVSVTDKTNLAEFAKGLSELGCQLIATDGTNAHLKKYDIKTIDLADFSDSPALFSGRIKSLTFKVQSAILYDRFNPQHQQEAKEHQISTIDCVICNFYDFQKALNQQKQANADDNLASIIEHIDIGGPNMVRAAAKNFKSVLVITDPDDYQIILKELTENEGAISYNTRLLMMKKAFRLIYQYDQLIFEGLTRKEIKYGENSHQQAYYVPFADDYLENLSQNQISYNNYLDVNAALELLYDIDLSLGKGGLGNADKMIINQCAVVIKHNNPCGLASAKDLAQALKLALDGDKMSAFGSVVGVSGVVDMEIVNSLKGIFIEVIVAFDYEKEALTMLKKLKRKLKIIKVTPPSKSSNNPWQRRSIENATLLQSKDVGTYKDYQAVTKKKFTNDLLGLAKFAMLAVKSLKSNAVAIARYHQGAYQLISTGSGQTNRLDAVRLLAIPRALDNFKQLDWDKCVLASDAFFPFADSIESLAQHKLKHIVQPGGSIRDKEVINACDEHDIAMILTNRRHFKH